jgi:hypothetical protein
MKCFFLPNGPWVSRDSTAAPLPVATANAANSHCFAAGGQRRRQKKKSGAQPEANWRLAVRRDLQVAGGVSYPTAAVASKALALVNGATFRSYLSLAGISFPVAGTKWIYPKLATPWTSDASQCGTGGPGLRRHRRRRLPDRIDAPAHDGQRPVQPRQDVYLAGRSCLPAEFVATGGGGRLSLDREPLFP